MTSSELELVKSISVQSARRAGEILLKRSDRVQVIKEKGSEDVCTNLDLEVETLIIEAIKAEPLFREHAIDSEEMGYKPGNSEYTWVIDPIDGSKHYLRGIPVFSVSIALKHRDKTLFGLNFNPATQELFYALERKGAYLNDAKISVSERPRLKDAFVYAELLKSTLPEEIFARSYKQLKALLAQCFRVRAFGSGSLGLCYVAKGAFEAYVDLCGTTKIYDVTAGCLMVEEAGGQITILEERMFPGYKWIVASNGKIHGQILELLKSS
jgi:myo-inositol-1(or 4)-monophosphatase